MPEKIKLQLFPIDEATLVGLEKVKINGMLTPPKKRFQTLEILKLFLNVEFI